jgi:hypothetical protein
LNYDANREIAQLRIQGLESDNMEECESEWKNMSFESHENI